MLNILIRTSYRPQSFQRCLDSIYAQSYKDINIIVSYDNEDALAYIPDNLTKIRVHKSDLPFYYDNYCNDLKAAVTDGYFMFVDDDDILLPNSLLSVARYFKGPGVICQFSRGAKLKPSTVLIHRRSIVRTQVGMPCIILHHSYKNMVDFDGSVGAADFHYIHNVCQRLKLTFVPIPVVYSQCRGSGVMENSR